MTVVKYVCVIDEGVEYELSHFRKYVHDILSHRAGWVMYGYTFAEAGANGADATVIHLSSNEYISSFGDDFKGMSVANCSLNHIHINFLRWMTGAKDTNPHDAVRVSMTLDEYRSYVIQHEVGHILWGCTSDDHKRSCVDGVAPIMLQQTNGVGEGCVPNTSPLAIDEPPT
jgi:hypothetical protein